MSFQGRRLWHGFGALVLAVAVVLAGVAVQPAAAQSPTCIIDVTESQTVSMFGFTRTVDRKVGTRIDPACLVPDGRLNHADAAAGAIIYCLPDAGIAVYDVDTISRGDLALSISAAELAAFPIVPEENTLVTASSSGAIRLYRLTSGELQINAPGIYPTDPEYVYIWNGCTAQPQ